MKTTTASPVLRIAPLGFPWVTADPFLFCAHHDDAYPAGNGSFGPAASLAGRDIGQDFSRKDGWSMYHGETVPGFPAHPHRGFETVTIVRSGLIDHADSLGAAARFGRGDVQWLTAGSGIVHAEMFPLLATDSANPLELFQIWLNLPAPPDSWAARPEADVAIWTIRMEPGARWSLPPAAGTGSRRHLYFFRGDRVRVGDEALRDRCVVEVAAGVPVALENDGGEPAEFLLLQGRPIGEPVAQYGPFVMNTQDEIRQALLDYRRTQFGGWPWPDAAPVHGSDPVRFARHPDGRRETA
jgi:redox-sensitive bicupin YhaK (pirin superfamily)